MSGYTSPNGNGNRSGYFLDAKSVPLILGFCVATLIAVSASCLVAHLVFGEYVSIDSAFVLGVAEIVVAIAAAGMIIFQLRQSDETQVKESMIAEAEFVLHYNQQFIDNLKMTMVEHELEQYSLGNMTLEEMDVKVKDDRQTYIDYLVYLEGLATNILNGVIDISHVDSLFAYRYFVAVNNPVLQDEELAKFPDYYYGCFKVYKDWVRYRISHGLEIPLFATALSDLPMFSDFTREDRTCRNVVKCRDLLAERPDRFDLHDPRSEERACALVSGLIYDTDEYIYPAMFKNRDDALVLIADLIRSDDDAMFNARNIFVAEAGGRVVGLILWHKGGLEWSSGPLRRAAKARGISLPDTLAKVESEYVSGYGKDVPQNRVSILNVCVGEELRGMGVGRAILEAFIKTRRREGRSSFELCVLESNEGAVKLYKKMGFSTVGRDNGFSVDDRKLPRLTMRLG